MTHVRTALDRIGRMLEDAAHVQHWEVWEVDEGVARDRTGTLCTSSQLARRPLRAGVGRIVVHRVAPEPADEGTRP